MKVFDKLIAAVVFVMLCLFAAAHFALAKSSDDESGLYRIEINRIEHDIMNGAEPSADSYETIRDISEYNGEAEFFDTDGEYVIREINGKFYRIEYIDRTDNTAEVRRLVDRIFIALALVTIGSMIYLRQHILKPFNEISELPRELAKGNIAAPVKESKSRYFGRFVWGLDMLREQLESSKQKRLEKLKAEKTMLLSLSHDIKTPLAAIKLYSKALSKGLYTDRDKQIEVAENINDKADEIERFINELIKKADDDFMTFDINMSEFYLSEVVAKIANDYSDRLTAAGMTFKVNEYSDCLLSGDADRLVEVLQNIIENAVKYGDGHSISLTFSEEEDCRLITVSNSGCTLPEGELAHVFDSFWRGSNAGSRQGSGLGLYICRRLMGAMGGDIYAEISDGCMNVTAVCKKK